MPYSIVNVVTFGLGLLFLYSGYRLVATGREDVPVFLLTGTVGLGLMVVAVFPDLFWGVANVTGIELRSRAMLVVANLTLFTIVVYLLNRIGRLSEQVSRLNEELSLVKAEVVEDRDDE